MQQKIETSAAPAPIGPYNQAILAGNTLYISGQIAIDPQSGDLRTQSLEEETKQVMQNLKAILNEAGLDFPNVVKCNIFLKDMGAFGEVNKIYGSFFNELAPARETVEVSALPKNANVEISAIAVKP